MRPDEVRVIIGAYEFTEIESMELVSDLYDPAGSFRVTVGRKASAATGARFTVFIGRTLEMSGIVDRIEESASDNSHTWTASGKSMIGLVGRFYLTDWSSPPNTLAEAAKKYLAAVPLVSELPWSIEGADPSVPNARLDVGDTVFKVLNEYAQNRGLLFWAKTSGEIVFGKAAGKGEPDFHLNQNTVQKRSMVEDGSVLHSDIVIVSDSDEGHKVHKAMNSSAPLQIPFAAAYNGHDSAGMDKQAHEYIRQEKLQALQLDYTVSGFSCDGQNWSINKRVSVVDETFGLRDTYLLRTRVFSFDRSQGSTTRLVLTPILAEDVFKAYPKAKKRSNEW